MKKPDFVPTADWKLVVSLCSKYNVDPYLIAAIGWHETHWNTHPRSPNNYHLGYGYFPGSKVKAKYYGLKMQVKGALDQFHRWMQSPITLASITELAVYHWKSGAPRAWARSIFSIYTSIKEDFELPVTDTEVKDLSKRVEIIEYTIKLFKEFIKKLAKEFGSER